MTTAALLPDDSERYRILVEAVTDYAIYMLDTNGCVVSWNAGARRFKGYEKHQILGQHFSTFYTPEDRDRGMPAHALKTAAAVGRFEGEGWRVRQDGTRFWANAVIDPIRNEAGDLIGYAKVTRDLTERKLAEEALRSSEQRFRLLVQSVIDYGIYMLDIDGNVTNWNAGAERIKGYSEAEILGKHFSTFYTDEDRAAGEPARGLRLAREEGRFEKEGWRVRKDGTRFQAHVVIDPIRDDNGDLVGYAKVTRDVTERRAAQEALEKAREALFQSQKLEALGQLTGGVAHDFNNLLMVVLSCMQLVRKRVVEDAGLVRLVDNAIHGARRGMALTERMLAFARKQDLVRQPVDLPALVRETGELLQRAVGNKISIETRFALQVHHAMADANQLELALMNLVTNARDAMLDGGDIVIALKNRSAAESVAAGLPPQEFVTLAVTDTGTGMDAATLSKALEPFFTTKGLGKGTGLGLPMVHGVAQQLGGTLKLHSTPGAGTTAEIWLPIAQDTVIPEAIAAVEAALPAHGPLAVLLVDDDELVLLGTSAMLEDQKHSVSAVSSGAAALALLNEGHVFDLVITDYAMPDMTGLQLAETIAARWPRLPIVLATGYAELPPDAMPLQRLGKPYQQDELARVVAGCIGARRV
ncbi:hybrid sensor histidine kinase/response regulator [Amantichitinum ursilacus]|uniref:histidine kinase n=1 Tax=Amantichitinum ursilacus TaxID=857265 RepID=A0A0N0XG41_9NEIS|nr:PAS domain-containing sensor histidine kinase [Amantichitinum ursilacus]KPC49659.1 Blue-light-activated protein [Amantichitinum ursilacus]